MPSSTLGLFFAFCVPSLLGFALLHALERLFPARARTILPFIPAVALGTLIGWLCVTFSMRVQHKLGFPATGLYTFAFPLVFASVLFLFSRRRSRVIPLKQLEGSMERINWLPFWVIVAMLALPLLFEVGLQPLPGWDAWEFWAARAKVWFFTGDLSDNRLQRNEEYPPAISLMMLWIARGADAWRDDLFGYVSLIHYLSAAAIMYWALATRFGIHSACVGVLFALGAPMLAVHSTVGGYADLPLACVLAAGSSLLLALNSTGKFADYALPIVLALCLPFYKIPGIFWMAILFIGIGIHDCFNAIVDRPKARVWRIALVVGLALGAVAVLGFESSSSQPASVFQIGNYTLRFALNDGALFVFTELFIAGSFLVLWFAVAQTYFGQSGRRELESSAAILSLSVVVVLGLVFVLSAVFLTNTLDWWQDGSTLNRALIHVAPTAILLVVVYGFSRNSINDQLKSSIN